MTDDNLDVLRISFITLLSRSISGGNYFVVSISLSARRCEMKTWEWEMCNVQLEWCFANIIVVAAAAIDGFSWKWVVHIGTWEEAKREQGPDLIDLRWPLAGDFF